MSGGRILLFVFGLILALLLSGAVYFLRPAGNLMPPTSSHSPGEAQASIPQPIPEAASPAQPAATTPPPPAQVNSNSTPTYQYNAQGQLQAIIYPDGSTYTYQYNPHGDKIRETSSKTGKTWSYIYDPNDHPLTVIDPEGGITHPAAPPAAPNVP